MAGRNDLGDLARLRWLDAEDEREAKHSVAAFAAELDAWWTAYGDSHHAFVAELDNSEVAGMAWLAMVPRVPRPGATTRLSGDIQSVFVLEEQRGNGIGSALVRAVTEHARRLGADRVTVHSSRQAVPVYERLGFASSRELLQRPAG